MSSLSALFSCVGLHGAHAGLDNSVATAPARWRVVHDANEPHLQPLPAHFVRLSSVQKLLVVRVLRPDRVMPAVRDVVTEHMGQKSVTPPPFQLSACYAESSSTTPLVFVLSAGSDPTATLLQFASEREMDNRLHAISLGATATITPSSAMKFLHSAYSCKTEHCFKSLLLSK
jgi:dynein heavy chain, axonemal